MHPISTIFFLAIISALSARAQEDSTPSTSYSNNTSPSKTSTPPATAPVCCFVIQETVNEVWAEIYWTSTWYQVVNKTSVTARVTPYPNTTITNLETNVYTTNATFQTPEAYGTNLLQDFANNAPGPTETNSWYNASQIVIAGQTIVSPAAAYIYTTVKVITAAPVTDANGNAACATPWSFTPVLGWHGNTTTLPAATETQDINAEVFPSINSNAQAYWGSDVAGLSSSTLEDQTWTVTDSYSGYGTVPATATTATETGSIVKYFYVNSNFESINTEAAKQSVGGVTITLDEAFVYQPSTAAMGETGDGYTECRQGSGTEGWGYPPQTLIDYMAQNPRLSSQYPGLENCIPGGPSIMLPTVCSAVSPATEESGGDLTDTTTIMVTPTMPLDTAIPVSEGSTTSSPVILPQTTPLLATPSSSLAPPPVQTSSNNSPPPVIIPPAQSPPAGSPSPSVIPSTENISAGTPPSETTSPIENPGSSVISNIPPNQPVQSSAAVIASAIASGIGASPLPAPTVIGGATVIIASGQATIPYNPAMPVSGSTIVSGGSTEVIVSAVETLSLSQILESLPGSTVVVSGTLEVVLGPTTIPVNSKLPGLEGSTTIIDGSTYVVVTGPTTVPVVLGTPTSIAGGGSSATSPLQASAGARSSTSIKLVVLLGGSFIALFIV